MNKKFMVFFTYENSHYIAIVNYRIFADTYPPKPNWGWTIINSENEIQSMVVELDKVDADFMIGKYLFINQLDEQIPIINVERRD